MFGPGKKGGRGDRNGAEGSSDGEGERYGLEFLTHREGQLERWEGESVLVRGKGNKAFSRGRDARRYNHPPGWLGLA